VLGKEHGTRSTGKLIALGVVLALAACDGVGSVVRRESRGRRRAEGHQPLVHLDAMLMRTDPALTLTSRRCILSRLTSAGFECTHTTFESAIDDLVTPKTS
jgi:hypothetical protein